MTLNDVQVSALRAFVRGEPVDSIWFGHISSGWSPECSVCGKQSMYPLLVGIGPEVQAVWHTEKDKYAVLCKECELVLKAEHFRRTAYDQIFTK